MIGGPIGWPIGGIIVAEDSRSAELAVTLDALTLSSTAAVTIAAELTKALDDATLAATGTVAIKAAAAITLDDATLASTGVLPIVGALAKTLDDVTLSAASSSAIVGALNVTLDDLTYTIHGGPELTITDLEVLQLPVDCVLAGQQHYKQSGREYEIYPMNKTERTWGRHSSVRALKGGKPSFTVTTGKRGYD